MREHHLHIFWRQWKQKIKIKKGSEKKLNLWTKKKKKKEKNEEVKNEKKIDEKEGKEIYMRNYNFQTIQIV